jgi:hypothetical protein
MKKLNRDGSQIYTVDGLVETKVLNVMEKKKSDVASGEKMRICSLA